MKTKSELGDLWKTLQRESVLSGFRRYEVTHSLDFYLGFDSDGRHAFLIVCADRPPAQSDMKSIRVKVQERDDEKWSLFLILDSPALFDMFHLLCADLVESSRKALDVSIALKLLFARLVGWRQLMEKGNSGLLSEHEVRGLVGELVYLMKLMDSIGESSAVAGWVGPHRADQDFQIGGDAWEVKTIRPGSNVVSIASERQLDTQARQIVLVAVELANSHPVTDGAFSLNSIVANICTRLEPYFDEKVEFENLLFISGYTPRVEYETYYFELRSVAEFEVLDGFPALTVGVLPAGIKDASYKLDLSACSSYKRK